MRFINDLLDLLLKNAFLDLLEMELANLPTEQEIAESHTFQSSVFMRYLCEES